MIGLLKFWMYFWLRYFLFSGKVWVIKYVVVDLVWCELVYMNEVWLVENGYNKRS